MNYRRAWDPGGTFFFTLALRDRNRDTLVRNIDDLRHAFRGTREKNPWRTDAIGVLPEHLRVLWTMPESDVDYPGYGRAIKSNSVRRLRKKDAMVRANARGEADVWQRRFWEDCIRNEDDFVRPVASIHINPVKHGHVDHAADRRWPSIHRFV